MKVEVVCYSGYEGDERPVRFPTGWSGLLRGRTAGSVVRAAGRLFQSESERRQRVTSFGGAQPRLKVNGAWNRSVTSDGAAERKCLAHGGPNQRPQPTFDDDGTGEQRCKPARYGSRMDGH